MSLGWPLNTLVQSPNNPWWRHQMETFSALLAICAGNSPVPGEFPAQRPVTRSFDVFFDLRLNKRLSKQSWGWWFETLSCPLWRHSNAQRRKFFYSRWPPLPDVAYCYTLKSCQFFIFVIERQFWCACPYFEMLEALWNHYSNISPNPAGENPI